MSKKSREQVARRATAMFILCATVAAPTATAFESHESDYERALHGVPGAIQTTTPITNGRQLADVPPPQPLGGIGVTLPKPYAPQTSTAPTTTPVSDGAPSQTALSDTNASPELIEATSAPIPGTAPQPYASAPIPGADTSTDIAVGPLPSEPLPPGSVATSPRPLQGGVVVIDMDDEKPQPPAPKNQVVWKELPDTPDTVCISAGAQLPIINVSSVTSKHAKVGDPVEARLKFDLKIGGRMIATRGSKVIGHVCNSFPARRLLMAEMGLKRWMRANGALGIQFDEIITDTNEHVPLVAEPARRRLIVNNKGTGRVLGVNHDGQIASPLSIQLKHQGVHLAIRAAAAAGGIFTMGAVPVAFGIMGAIDPAFAFMHPVGKNVHHRRLKGAAMGVLSGLPGGFIVADFLIKGVEAEIKPGDEFLVEFKKDFTGEASTAAELLPHTHKKLHGEILPWKKSRKSNVPPDTMHDAHLDVIK